MRKELATHVSRTAAIGRRAPIACCTILLLALALWPHLLVAQPADQRTDDIQLGDAWVYNRTDEITGELKTTLTSLVTAVSPEEIETHTSFRGQNGHGIVVFDHAWNRTLDSNIKYKPNDGHGVHLPLAVGKEWRLSYTSSNAKNGVNMKATSQSKVVAQESITTPAGTFDTFKIDRQVKEFNTADPSRLFESQFLMWFSLQINHWVRRTFILRAEKRVRNSTTDELIEVKRKS